jgi:hypothetical protein
MCTSEDTKQRLQSAVAIAANGYKICMASLLCIFVPQKCDNRECTIMDNFQDLTPFNTLVLVFNLITLAMFLAFFAVEFFRENWCIEYLDYDETKPITQLKSDIEHYPSIKDKLFYMNNMYMKTTCVTILFSIVNFAISGVLVFRDYYLDFKTVTVWFTYLLLIADKMMFSLQTSIESNEKCVPTSAYRTGPVVFNVIDSDHTAATEMTNVDPTRT